MQKNKRTIIEKLQEDCCTLEEQVKVLVRTEVQLRRTKAELTQSKKKIEEYNKTLEQRVEERTKELLISNEKLRQEMVEREKAETELKKLEEILKRAERMEAIGLLAGSVAHDLNNLLTCIIEYPNLLSRKIPGDSPLCTHLNAIKTCGEKAAAVVRDLSILSRKGILNTELFNLNDILHTIINSPEFARMKKDYPNVTVDNKMYPPAFNMNGSPVEIYNAIIHLILNALESMKNGGVLTISTENVYIDKPKRSYEIIDTGEYVTATISDTGTGIPKKHLDRIFEPFYSRKIMRKSGTGLGMAVVWGTVKEHKGFIDITSTEGKETSVTLYFPASRKAVAPKKRNGNLKISAGKTNQCSLSTMSIPREKSVRN